MCLNGVNTKVYSQWRVSPHRARNASGLGLAFLGHQAFGMCKCSGDLRGFVSLLFVGGDLKIDVQYVFFFGTFFFWGGISKLTFIFLRHLKIDVQYVSFFFWGGISRLTFNTFFFGGDLKVDVHSFLRHLKIDVQYESFSFGGGISRLTFNIVFLFGGGISRLTLNICFSGGHLKIDVQQVSCFLLSYLFWGEGGAASQD